MFKKTTFFTLIKSLIILSCIQLTIKIKFIMKKLTLLVASLMIATFTFAQQGSLTFAANSLDITQPLADIPIKKEPGLDQVTEPNSGCVILRNIMLQRVCSRAQPSPR